MIRVITWCSAALYYLERVEGLNVEDVQKEIETGVAQLWECSMGMEVRGYVVTRLEQRVDSLGNLEREWVWLACAGKGFRHYVVFFLNAARTQNLPIRVYVRRPGMRRLYESLGFKADTVVMRLRNGIR